MSRPLTGARFRGALDKRAYPASLQQAAAAVFGIAVVDGLCADRPLPPSHAK